MTGLDLTTGVRVVPEDRLVSSRNPDSCDGWLVRLLPAAGAQHPPRHVSLEPDDSFLVSHGGEAMLEYFEYATANLADGVYAADVSYDRVLTAEAFLRIKAGAVERVTTDPAEAARWLDLERERGRGGARALGMEALAARLAGPGLSR